MADHPSDEDMRERGEALSARIAGARARLPENRAASNPTRGTRGAAEGFKIASEFVAGILVGAAIGFGIDSLAGTKPFGLVVFLLVGFAAGVLNVVRATAKTPGGTGGPSDPPR